MYIKRPTQTHPSRTKASLRNRKDSGSTRVWSERGKGRNLENSRRKRTGPEASRMQRQASTKGRQKRGFGQDRPGVEEK